MLFTLWQNNKSPEGAYSEIEWKAFLEFVAAPKIAADKNSLEGWSPARFTGNRRSRANVEAVSLLVLDDDASGLTTDALAAKYATAAGIVHTSFSHTLEAPKHRIALRLSRDVTADEHARLWATVVGAAAEGGQLLDRAACDASRLWYCPAHREGAPYAWAELTGAALDVDALLAMTPAEQSTAPAPAERTATVAPDEARHKAVAVLVAAYPAKGRHLVQRAIAGGLIRDNWGETEATEFLCDVCRGAGNEDREKRIKTVRSTLKRKAEGKPYDGWTTLERYIGADLVSGVRKLLDGTATMERAVAEREPIRNAPNDVETDLGEVVFDWDQHDAPIRWVVQDIIQEATVNLLFGKPNSRKSWLAWLMAAAVAMGAPWLGKIALQGLVIILDYEGSPRTSRRRMRLLKKAGLKNIRYFNPKLALDNETLWKRIATMGACLVIVDSLSRGMLRGGVKDQASDPRMSVPLDLAKQIARELGTSTVFIHHGNKGDIKGQDAVRGSGAIYAAAEGCFEAIRDDDTRTTLRCDRQKEGESFPDLVVELTNDKGLQLVDVKVAPAQPTSDQNREIILSRLQGKPAGLPKADLMAVLIGQRDVRHKAFAELALASITVEYKAEKKVYVMLNPNRRDAS